MLFYDMSWLAKNFYGFRIFGCKCLQHLWKQRLKSDDDSSRNNRVEQLWLMRNRSYDEPIGQWFFKIFEEGIGCGGIDSLDIFYQHYFLFSHRRGRKPMIYFSDSDVFIVGFPFWIEWDISFFFIVWCFDFEGMFFAYRVRQISDPQKIMIKILTDAVTHKLLNCAWFADTFGPTDDKKWMLRFLISEKIIDAGRKKFYIVWVWSRCHEYSIEKRSEYSTNACAYIYVAWAYR